MKSEAAKSRGVGKYKNKKQNKKTVTITACVVHPRCSWYSFKDSKTSHFFIFVNSKHEQCENLFILQNCQMINSNLYSSTTSQQQTTM